MKHIKTLLEGYKDNKRGLMVKLRYDQELVNEITNMTIFLDSKSSLSERVYCLYNNITEKPICPICGKQKKFEKMDKGFFSSCGDNKCKKQVHLLNITIANEKKDHKAIYEKCKKTNLERYGVEHTQSKDSKFRDKRNETMIDKYGSIHALQIDEIKCKQQETFKIKCIEKEHGESIREGRVNKYGSYEKFICAHSNIIKESSRIRKEKSLDILHERIGKMGFEIVSYDTDYYKLKCITCGTIINTRRAYINVSYRKDDYLCYKCNPIGIFRSKFEQDVADYISSIYDGEVVLNNKSNGAEIDIYLPNKRIGFECNGVYWHSEIYKSPIAHKEKRDIIERHDIDLIQIWEDDWYNVIKNGIIKSRIKSKLNISERIYARKCKIIEVGKDEVKIFLDENHLQGYACSSINIGLYYKDELVSVCTFSRGRNSIKTKNEKGYELIRNCTKKGYNIVGGFSKMVSYFSKTYSNNIYSYADCDWVSTSHNGYLSCGFEIETHTQPNYWWAKNIRENRIKYQKHKLVEQGFDASKSESEIMHSRGFRKVYGSGNIKFRYKNIKE